MTGGSIDWETQLADLHTHIKKLQNCFTKTESNTPKLVLSILKDISFNPAEVLPFNEALEYIDGVLCCRSRAHIADRFPGKKKEAGVFQMNEALISFAKLDKPALYLPQGFVFADFFVVPSAQSNPVFTFNCLFLFFVALFQFPNKVKDYLARRSMRIWSKKRE